MVELLDDNVEAIAAALAAAAADRRLEPNPESLAAWRGSTQILRATARELIASVPAAASWRYFLEFEVPRRSRRIDTVLLADDLIFLIEWKVGSDTFDRAARWQTEQYALDMRDFHEGTYERTIFPILVATAALTPPSAPSLDRERLVQPVASVTASGLGNALRNAWEAGHDPLATPVDHTTWEDSPYRPTPGIVEAAKLLYEHHDVREISNSSAQNLDATVDAVLDLVDVCQREHRRGIAFITGAPGSGKTLAGLQVVHAPEVLGDSEARGVFLSGNMPLVEVITEALSKSATLADKKRDDARREVRTFIQHAYLFRNEYAEHPERAPAEHVVLFDEAQRAWDRAQVERWTRGASTRSEPEILLDVMNRAPDWAVVIALVGSGQEINRGEAGLGEWGRSLRESHPDWIIRAAPAVLPNEVAPPGGRLFDEVPPGLNIGRDPRLTLRMNVRSPRAELLNRWVDYLLELRLEEARDVYPDQSEFPMAMTRSLDSARAWLRDRADEDQRSGLLASAEARRLRAWGIDTKILRQEKSWADWFLRPRGDVRGSDQLEIAATNFDCQGLEIDWGAICWGNDLVPTKPDADWRITQFTGTTWKRANEEKARFILNGYRVILTRSRRGQIIWVPQPDGSDPTLPPGDFDRIAEILQAAGVPLLD